MANEFTPRARRLTAVLELVAIVVVFLVLAFYVIAASSNRDLLWFYPFFDEVPLAVTVYRQGRAVTLTPADPGFDALVAAINAEIPRHAGYFESLAVSPEQMRFFRERGYAVEMIYPAPVQIHTRYFFPAAPRLLIALDGPYNYTNAILLFRGSNERWLPGAIALAGVERTRAVVEALLATTP